MVEVLDQSSGKLIGLKVSGKLLHKDYQTFVPMLEKLIEEHGGIRCLVEMTDLHGIELRACGTRSSSMSITRVRSNAARSLAIGPGKPG